MGLIQTIQRTMTRPWLTERDNPAITLDQYIAEYLSYAGNTYPLTTFGGNAETIEANFRGMVAGAYKSNGIVFACMLARQMLFSQARFGYRRIRSGKPGEMFGDSSLTVLEKPWRGGTTADLLSRAIQDTDLAGTAFNVRRRRDRISRLRPDWVTMVIGSPFADADDDMGADDIEAELLGLLYYPGGPGRGRDPEIILAENVSIFAPIPDPLHPLRGQSWLTAVRREIEGDSAATTHKLNYWDKGATVNLVVQTGIPADQIERFKEWVKLFREKHEGAANSFKTLFLTPGADATPIGSNLQEATFKDVQGAGETRIAAAAGMHPVVVGLSEGLQGASLNAGNFQSARRLTADKTLRPLWANFAGSISTIVQPPEGAELWIHETLIPFLAEDVKDAAEVQKSQASSIQTLINAGFKADAVISAITAGDLASLRGQHTGLFSVQLQPPKPNQPEPDPDAALTNGQAGDAKPAQPAAEA